jgi:hypothetical protein
MMDRIRRWFEGSESPGLFEDYISDIEATMRSSAFEELMLFAASNYDKIAIFSEPKGEAQRYSNALDIMLSANEVTIRRMGEINYEGIDRDFGLENEGIVIVAGDYDNRIQGLLAASPLGRYARGHEIDTMYIARSAEGQRTPRTERVRLENSSLN